MTASFRRWAASGARARGATSTRLVLALAFAAAAGAFLALAARRPAPSVGVDVLDLDAADGRASADVGDTLQALVDAPPALHRASLVSEGAILDRQADHDGTIRVVDARTGIDLPEVFVVPTTCTGAGAEWPVARILDASCSTRAGSPLRPSEAASQEGFWLGSSGYAWRRVEPGGASGSPLFGLVPGGELLVEIAGDPLEAQGCVLRLERVSGTNRERLLEHRLEPALALSGLPCGELVGSIVKVRKPGEEVILAERKTEVTPGAPAVLQLRLRDEWSEGSAGWMTVRFDVDSADVVALEARITPVGAEGPVLARRELERMTELDRSRRRWRVADVPPGRWRVSVLPTNLQVEVDVEPGSNSSVDVVVPKLSTLKLWPIDVDSGDPVAPELVSWTVAGPDGPWRSRWFRPTLVGGVLELPVTPGSCELTVRAAGFVSASKRTDVTAGWNEDLIELERYDPRSVCVLLRWAGHAIPAPESTWTSSTVRGPSGASSLVQLELPDPARANGRPGGGATALLTLNGPGPHTLELGPLPGFRAPGPKVLLSTPEEREVVLDLVPWPR